MTHININSLRAKIEELRSIFLKSQEASVIGISESKIDKSVLDGEIGGYELERNDRN